MIKIISITLILFFFTLSCGKKEDPVYKESKRIIKYPYIHKNKI